MNLISFTNTSLQDFGLKDESVTQCQEGSTRRCMKANVFKTHETVIQVSLFFTFGILDLAVRVGVFLFFDPFLETSASESKRVTELCVRMITNHIIPSFKSVARKSDQ